MRASGQKAVERDSLHEGFLGSRVAHASCTFSAALSLTGRRVRSHVVFGTRVSFILNPERRCAVGPVTLAATGAHAASSCAAAPGHCRPQRQGRTRRCTLAMRTHVPSHLMRCVVHPIYFLSVGRGAVPISAGLTLTTENEQFTPKPSYEAPRQAGERGGARRQAARGRLAAAAARRL